MTDRKEETSSQEETSASIEQWFQTKETPWKWKAVRSYDETVRESLKSIPHCPELKDCGVSHLGQVWVDSDTRPVPIKALGALLLMPISDGVEISIDGHRRRGTSREPQIVSSGRSARIRAKDGNRFTVSWISFLPGRANLPDFDPDNIGSITHAVIGLTTEANKPPKNLSTLELWLTLLAKLLEPVVSKNPASSDDRLARIWKEVETDLARDWSLEELCAIGHISRAQLRRLCKDLLGRTPIQQLTHLRMCRAKKLLLNTDETLESIASQVGYESGFGLSNAYKRWCGHRPSDFRPRG